MVSLTELFAELLMNFNELFMNFEMFIECLWLLCIVLIFAMNFWLIYWLIWWFERFNWFYWLVLHCDSIALCLLWKYGTILGNGLGSLGLLDQLEINWHWCKFIIGLQGQDPILPEFVQNGYNIMCVILGAINPMPILLSIFQSKYQSSKKRESVV